MTRSFVGKTVVVTGAGSGIGAGCAQRFAAEGANVVLVGRTRAKLDAVAADLPADRALVHTADVSERATVEAMVAATVARFGRIDTLVANAGIGLIKPFADLTPDDWRGVMATNVDGVFHSIQAALPHLREKRGSVVVVASVSGMRGDWGMSAYDASKGAVVNLVRALALDFGAFGVRVNAVAPSVTESEMTAPLFDHPDILAQFHDRIALGRHALPDEVAGPVAFLASEDARFVTGAILPVDGGVSASNGQPRIGA